MWGGLRGKLAGNARSWPPILMERWHLHRQDRRAKQEHVTSLLQGRRDERPKGDKVGRPEVCGVPRVRWLVWGETRPVTIHERSGPPPTQVKASMNAPQAITQPVISP